MAMQYSTPAFPQGVEASASFVPVAGAYVANDVMGVVKQFDLQFAASTYEVPNGTLFNVREVDLKNAVLTVPPGMTTFNLHLYTRTPTVIADKDTWLLNAADVDYYLGALLLTAPVLPAPGSGAIISRTEFNRFLALEAASPDLFGYLTTTGPYTAAATAIKVHMAGLAV